MDLFGNSHQAHGPSTWRPDEMFVDTRQFGYSNGTSDNSSRFVKLPRTTPDGGAIARSKEHDKFVVVGRETIRLITITDTKHHLQPAQQYSTNGKGNTSQTRTTGPGGAIAEIGPNFWSTKFPSTMLLTDVTWGPQDYSSKVFTSCTNGEVIVWDLGKGGLKYDSSLYGGARSVNVVKAATFSPYSIATGSTDGSVKLWDLRLSKESKAPAFTLGQHMSAVRSMTFGQVAAHPVHVVFGLENGAIFRYDLRLGIAYLDRISAHSACVHDLAWLPTKDEGNIGFLASGSFDHTVKVWNIDSTRIGVKPLHTIHTSYPVGKVGWRPFYDTEVLVVPYHGGWAGAKAITSKTGHFDANEKYAPQIWDVRKGWLAKWQLPTVDGPVTDVCFSEANATQVLYKSGAFAQLDLRETIRPADTIGRHALSWNANSSLFFVADPVPLSEPPYDDLHPAISSMLDDYGFVDKRPGDRLGVATTQVLGSQFVVPDLDRESYMKLARGYNHHDTDKVKMCQRNEEVATRAGQHEVAQTWALLGSLLSEFERVKTEEIQRHSVALPSEPPLSATTPMSAKAPQSAREPVSMSPPIIAHPGAMNPKEFTLDGAGLPAAATRRKGSGGSSMLLGVAPSTQRRRESSPSMLANLRPQPRSPSSSPMSKLAKLPSSNTGVNVVGSMISRHFLARRMSRSSSSNSPGPGIGVAEQRLARKSFVNAGEGALEDSSSEEEESAVDDSDERVVHSETSLGGSWTQEKQALTTLSRQHPTLHSSSSSNRSSPAISGKRLLPSPHLTSTIAGLPPGSRVSSPQTQLLDIQDVTEDSGQESDETDEDDDGSRSAESRRRKSGSSDDDHRLQSQNGIDVRGDSNVKHSPPSPTLAKYIAKSNESSRTATISRAGRLRALSKQESTSSMATAYQTGSIDLATSPSYGASSVTPTMGTVRISTLVRKDTDQTIGLNDVLESNESSARKSKGSGDSPSTKPLSLRNLFDPLVASTVTTSPSAANPARPPLPRTMSHSTRLNRGTHGTLMSSSGALGSAGPEQNGFDLGLVVEKETKEETPLAQTMVHDLEKQEKNAMFDVVKEMLEMYAEEGDVQMCAALAMAAHEQLDIGPERLESFVLSYMDQLVRMRLHLNAAYVRQSAPVHSIVESTAFDVFVNVNCGRCGKMVIDDTKPLGAPGRLVYCMHCKRDAIKCTICHLPVRRMLFFCHTCGHGGHHRCYREFYSHHSLIDLRNPKPKFPYAPHDDPRPASLPYHGPRIPQTRSVSVDDSFMEDDRRTEGASPAPRGRKRDIRRGLSDIDSPETIPERGVAQFTSSGSSGALFGVLPHKDGARRSLSTAESTIVDDEVLMPEEEYVLVREQEAEQRLAARRDMHLFAHPCAAGCGHLCWMAKD